MDTDKTSVSGRKALLTASTDRIRSGIEENLRYSHLARKDTMDVKSRSVHSIYEARMYKLYELIQKEMDLIEYSIAKLAVDSRMRVPIEQVVASDVVEEARQKQKSEADDKAARAAVSVSTSKESPASTAKLLDQHHVQTSDGDIVESSKPVTHGTVTGYSARKCRCMPCKMAKSEEGRKYRERRQARREASSKIREKSFKNG